MRILGIDPGVRVTGYGLISGGNDEPECLTYGCLKIPPDLLFHDRLKRIYDGVFDLIETHEPTCVVLEDVFYSRNVKSAFQLGQARAAAVLAAVNSGVSVAAYAAREIKLSVTGNGAASKEQVRHMVQHLLNLIDLVCPMDASDALAIALCHSNRNRTNASS